MDNKIHQSYEEKLCEVRKECAKQIRSMQPTFEEKQRKMYDEIPEGMIRHVGITCGQFSCRNCEYYGLYEGQNFKEFYQYLEHFIGYHMYTTIGFHFEHRCSKCGKDNKEEPLKFHFQNCPGWQNDEIMIKIREMGYKICFEHNFVTKKRKFGKNT